LVFIGLFVDFFQKPIQKILGDMNDYRNLR